MSNYYGALHQLEGFTMVKFTVKQKLQALNLLKEGYSSCSVAQMIGTGSHQLIDTWAAQYQHFGVKGLEIRHTSQNYRGQFKLQVLNWRKEHDETYQNTAIHFKIATPSLICTWQKRFDEGGLDALFTKRGRPPMNKLPKKPVKYTSSELSELERLRLENRQLHIENDYLKKVEALARRKDAQRKKNGPSSKS